MSFFILDKRLDKLDWLWYNDTRMRGKNIIDRFFGMMPSDCIQKEKTYIFNGVKLTIQAGENGWSILYGDGSHEYEDVEDTTENNFTKAYLLACEDFFPLEDITVSKN